MSDGLASRFPDLSSLQQTGLGLRSGIGDLIDQVAGLAEQRPGSPLSSVTGIIADLNAKVSVDTDPVGREFPAALTVIRNAIPGGAVDFVRSIESAYGDVRGTLADSHLVRAIGEDGSLEAVALAAVQDSLDAFDTHREDLLNNLVDADTLITVTDAFSALEGFESDFAANRASFLPFLSRNLIGIAPDLLAQPRAHVDDFLSRLAPLTREGLNAAVKDARGAVATALVAVSNALDNLDPAVAAGYAAIQQALDALLAAIQALLAAMEQLYATASDAIRVLTLDALFDRLRSLLDAITIAPAISVDEVVRSLAVVLDAMLARLQAFFGPDDIAQRIRGVTEQIHELFAQSALGQIQRSLNDFLDQIRQAIDAVPTDAVKTAIEEMLARVRQEVDKLGLERIGDAIDEAFQEIDRFVEEQLNAGVAQQVRAAIQRLLEQLRSLPIRAIADQLTQVLAQIQTLLDELRSTIEAGLAQIREVLSQLDGLSFKPVSEEVIAEIDDIKGRLAAINPNALSEAEKLALKGALAVLGAINLEDFVKTQVKAGFNAAKDALLSLLDQVDAALDTVRDRFHQYRPEELVHTVTEVIDRAEQSVANLDARVLLRPLKAGVDEIERQLAAHSPALLLQPLEAPYARVIDTVNHLNPDQLVAPLNSLYGQVDGLIGKIDATPLLEELDRRQQQLFADIRSAILAALDAVALPEPLASFYGQLRPVIEAMTGALFADPDSELKRIGVDLRGQLKPTDLFKPLDQVFDRLIGALQSIPEGDLVDTLNTLRSTVGEGIELLDPGRLIALLRDGRAAVVEASPRKLLAMPSNLPALKVSFERRTTEAPANMRAAVTATAERFDAVAALLATDGHESSFARLQGAHAALLDAVDQRLTSIDPAGAEEAYGRFKAQLTGVVPAFLRRAEPLSHADIIAGLATLRPSQQAAAIDRSFDRFMAALAPMETALEPAINEFFTGLRDTVRLISPLIVRDGVASIYDAVRNKARILDPEDLAAGLKTAAFEPAMQALGAIDPAALKERLQASFEKALQAITGTLRAILDDVGTALNEQLTELKAAVATLAGDIKETIASAVQSFGDLAQNLENLVVVDVLGRLRQIIETLTVSFDQELDRVVSAFDAMLRAIPLNGGGGGTTASVSA